MQNFIKKIIMATCLLLTLAVGAICVNTDSMNVSAAAKTTLSAKSLSVKTGSSKTLKLKNNTKKATWSVTSGKEYIKLSNKTKTSVKITGKKAGTAKVQAKVGKKKYTCTVKVTEANIEGTTGESGKQSDKEKLQQFTQTSHSKSGHKACINAG